MDERNASNPITMTDHQYTMAASPRQLLSERAVLRISGRARLDPSTSALIREVLHTDPRVELKKLVDLLKEAISNERDYVQEISLRIACWTTTTAVVIQCTKLKMLEGEGEELWSRLDDLLALFEALKDAYRSELVQVSLENTLP